MNINENFDLDAFLTRYLMESTYNDKGESSKEEMERFQSWPKAANCPQDEFEFLKLVFQQRSRDPRIINAEDVKERVWRKGVEEEKQLPSDKLRRFYTNNKVNRSWEWLKIAASLLTIVSLLFLLYDNHHFRETSSTEALENDLVINQNASGQKSRITLPDGSVVWLNAKSSLKYSRLFGDTHRVVSLDGEAYFEVVKDSIRSFIVNTRDLQVMALGTAFNITSYSEEKNTKVALVEGSVMITGMDSNRLWSNSHQSYVLQPGNGILFNLDNGIMEPFNFDFNNSNSICGWKDGYLVFDGEDFYTFSKTIERWYGIEVHVQGTPPKDWNIKGSFKNEYLANVLEAVKYNKHFDYYLNRDQLIVKFN